MISAGLGLWEPALALWGLFCFHFSLGFHCLKMQPCQKVSLRALEGGRGCHFSSAPFFSLHLSSLGTLISFPLGSSVLRSPQWRTQRCTEGELIGLAAEVSKGLCGPLKEEFGGFGGFMRNTLGSSCLTMVPFSMTEGRELIVWLQCLCHILHLHKALHKIRPTGAAGPFLSYGRGCLRIWS